MSSFISSSEAEAPLHRRYLTALLGSVLVSLALAGLLNRAVNPYSLFAQDWIESKSKPETFSHLRMVKAAQVRHVSPKGIILGSSRAETGLDPHHPLWPDQPVYNLGLSDAGSYEIRRYFQHALEVAPIKNAVLLLDYAAFLGGGTTAPDFTEERLATSPEGVLQPHGAWRDYLSGLLSWDACKGSIATILQSAADKRYLSDGSRDTETEERRVLNKGGAAVAFAAYESRALPLLAAAPPQLGEVEWSHLETVLDLARVRGVSLRLVIAPMHGRYLEMLVQTGHWTNYETWKRRVTALVEAEALQSKAPPFPLFDFGVYAPWTTEAVPSEGLAEYYFEASHFTKALGDHVLNRVLSDPNQAPPIPPGGFGRRLTSNNIDAHLSTIRERQRAYQETHAAELLPLQHR